MELKDQRVVQLNPKDMKTKDFARYVKSNYLEHVVVQIWMLHSVFTTEDRLQNTKTTFLYSCHLHVHSFHFFFVQYLFLMLF